MNLLVEHNGTGNYVLQSELSVFVCGQIITIPIGFETDFASSPRWLHGVFPSQGIHSRAAIVHDYLYEQRIWSKGKADRAFFALLISDGVPAWRAVAMYLAVKYFGSHAYVTGEVV